MVPPGQPKRSDLGHGLARNPSVKVEDDVALLREDPKNGNAKFLYPSEYEGHLEGVMISSNDILERTNALAQEIRKDYEGERPLMICLLKGAEQFYHNLLMALQRQRQGYTCEFIRASSYEGTESTGTVKVSGMDLTVVKDRHVIIVEDIVETGTTMAKVIPLLEQEGCRSIEVCSLLEKRICGDSHQTNIAVKYCGFSIPNKFIIGHGLDFNELYRDLADIWVISEEGIKCGGEL